MDVLKLGSYLLWVAGGLLGVMAILALAGIVLRDRRFVASVRVGFYGVLAVLLGSSICLVWGFLAGAYNNEYISSYSERGLLAGFKLAGLWAGLDGSLLFWTLILGAVSALAAFQHGRGAREPALRRMEPYTYLSLASILGFFVAISIHQNPFSEMAIDHRLWMARQYSIPLDSSGNLTDGIGLNPQLVNYWFVVHPPSLYLGFVIFSIPFAFALAALITGELGDTWIRVTRRWAMVGWLFLTCGIVLGGLWAYRQLGWGGYWAWDPVENASFLPWCVATAFLHSIMIQERRDMLRWWNVFLIIVTFFLTIEATYMTRSGEVSSVHSFAGGDIGLWFRLFKWAVALVGFFLLFFRFWDLRGAHRLESLLSREAAFYINNLVLVAIALVVWCLSWLPKNSHLFFGAKVALEPKFYNLVMTPLFVLLVFLTAAGPGLGWVKTSARSLRRNFLGPSLAAAAGTLAVYVFFFARGLVGSFAEVLIPRFLHQRDLWDAEAALYYPVGLYPTGILVFLSFLIMATVAAEFWRGIRARVQVRREDPLAAFLNLVRRDNRRYGGYVVHVGVALVTLGILASSLFQTRARVTPKVGEAVQVGPYLITPVEANRSFQDLVSAVEDIKRGRRSMSEVEPGYPYLRDEVVFRIRRAPGGDGTPQAHGASAAGNGAAEGSLVCELRPERRFYPRQNGGQGQWINEVSIHRMLLGDIYIYYENRSAGDEVALTVYLNPLMVLIWAGWFVMVFGGLFALIPMSGSRVGLAG